MKNKPSSVPDIIKNLNPVTEQFGPLSQNSDQMQIPGMANDAPAIKKHPKASPLKEDDAEKIENAAIIGGNAMASAEPFGPVIGAVMGATEEGVALLKKEETYIMIAPAVRPLKALIVDDNEPYAKMLMWSMEVAGYQARVAFDSLAAIQVLESFIPDILLLDITMPYMDGYDLCELLRDDTRLENALFIAQTGWGSEGHKKLSKKAGFHHHLVKPIDIEILLSIINREFKSVKA